MSSAGSDTHRPEERLLDLLGEDVEHFNRLCGQGQIGARHPLILSQLGLAALLLLLQVCCRRDYKSIFCVSLQLPSAMFHSNMTTLLSLCLCGLIFILWRFSTVIPNCFLFLQFCVFLLK